MGDLIPPHGGLSEPVSCTVPDGERQSFEAKAASLPKIPVSDADLSTVYRFGDGGLSPLTGPMNEAAWKRVLAEGAIEHGGKRWAWTIPLALPVTSALAGQLRPGTRAALVNGRGEVIGDLEIDSIYTWDKAAYLKSVYGTERTDHPGADMVLKSDADKTHLVGGRIRVLPQPKNPKFGKYILTPH